MNLKAEGGYGARGQSTLGRINSAQCFLAGVTAVQGPPSIRQADGTRAIGIDPALKENKGDTWMMRHLRTTLALAVMMGALALAAVPAMAEHFVASKTGKTVGRGFEEIEPAEKGSEEQPEFNPEAMQEFKLGAFKILCYSAHSKGIITETSSDVFQTTTKYSRCGWYPKLNSLHVRATFSKSGLTVRYHSNGYTEAVGNGSGEEIEYTKAELLETAATIKISATKLCTIVIPEQTIPVRAVKHPTDSFSAAVYKKDPVANENMRKFPTGIQQRLIVENEFKEMTFVYTGEEAQCSTAEEFEKLKEEEGGAQGGRYRGTLEEEVPGGDLTIE